MAAEGCPPAWRLESCPPPSLGRVGGVSSSPLCHVEHHSLAEATAHGVAGQGQSVCCLPRLPALVACWPTASLSLPGQMLGQGCPAWYSQRQAGSVRSFGSFSCRAGPGNWHTKGLPCPHLVPEGSAVTGGYAQTRCSIRTPHPPHWVPQILKPALVVCWPTASLTLLLGQMLGQVFFSSWEINFQ